jgi:hypothetical protein
VEDEYLGLFLGTGMPDTISAETHFLDSGVEANEYSTGGIFPLAHRWQNWIAQKSPL